MPKCWVGPTRRLLVGYFLRRRWHYQRGADWQLGRVIAQGGLIRREDPVPLIAVSVDLLGDTKQRVAVCNSVPGGWVALRWKSRVILLAFVRIYSLQDRLTVYDGRSVASLAL